MCCGSSSVDADPDPSFNMADKIANNVIKTAPDGPVRKDRRRSLGVRQRARARRPASRSVRPATQRIVKQKTYSDVKISAN